MRERRADQSRSSTARRGSTAVEITNSTGHGLVFSSRSTAGVVALGRSCNGHRAWIAGSETFDNSEGEASSRRHNGHQIAIGTLNT